MREVRLLGGLFFLCVYIYAVKRVNLYFPKKNGKCHHKTNDKVNICSNYQCNG